MCHMLLFSFSFDWPLFLFFFFVPLSGCWTPRGPSCRQSHSHHPITVGFRVTVCVWRWSAEPCLPWNPFHASCHRFHPEYNSGSFWCSKMCRFPLRRWTAKPNCSVFLIHFERRSASGVRFEKAAGFFQANGDALACVGYKALRCYGKPEGVTSAVWHAAEGPIHCVSLSGFLMIRCFFSQPAGPNTLLALSSVNWHASYVD